MKMMTRVNQTKTNVQIAVARMDTASAPAVIKKAVRVRKSRIVQMNPQGAQTPTAVVM